jgi:hypothetical protein
MEELNAALSAFGSSQMHKQMPEGWNSAKIETDGDGYVFCAPCPEGCDQVSCQHFKNNLQARGWEEKGGAKKKAAEPVTPTVTPSEDESPTDV